MSKGSEYRPFNKKKFDKEFERIFKKKEPKKKDEKNMAKLRHKKYLETEMAYQEHKSQHNTETKVLNPTWVEGLMGYPHGWTDLGNEE